MNEKMNDDNLLRTYKREGFTLRLYDLGYDYKQGKSRLGYELKDHKRVIFSGDDFFPSPLHAIDSLEVVYTLLDFLSLQAGDTDSEYFDCYTSEQLAWRDSSRSEQLNWIAYTGLERLGIL